MKTRYFVGHSQGKREVFQYAGIPTSGSHPEYSYCVGPFITRRAALWSTQAGAHFSTIREAERAAKLDYKNMKREVYDMTRKAFREAWNNKNIDLP